MAKFLALIAVLVLESQLLQLFGFAYREGDDDDDNDDDVGNHEDNEDNSNDSDGYSNDGDICNCRNHIVRIERFRRRINAVIVFCR